MKAWVEISKQNLFHNLYEITKNLKPETYFMAVLKSNAYGHGLQEVTELLLENPKSVPMAIGIRPWRKIRNSKHKLWFGVDSIEEALALQKISGAKIPILVLGYTPYEMLKKVPDNTRLVVYNLETIRVLQKLQKKIKIHIKIETGTQRQGIGVKDLPKFLTEIKKHKNVVVEGISSHFAEAENIRPNSLIRANKRIRDIDEPSPFTKKQLEIFNNASLLAEKILGKKLIKHIACSAAASHFPQSQCDLVRVGINLYGLQSVVTRAQEPRTRRSATVWGRRQNTRTDLLNLKPVLTWKTIVAQVKDIKRGMPIGYGRKELMPYNGQIAVLPIGYWDGYDRRLSSIGEVLIGSRRCRIIGRVCMNMCMALLPPKLAVKPEDEVILIGKQGREEIEADELADKMGTINYEVVTRINPLIKRVVSA